jgi:pyruvate kinase
VLAVTPSEEVQRRLLLYWGIVPLIGEVADDSDAMLSNALRVALGQGHIGAGDRVVILAGVPVHSPVMLNTIRVHVMGNVLAKGGHGFGGYVSGKVVKAESIAEARARLRRDGTEILLTKFLTPDFLPLVSELRGIIIEVSSYLGESQLQEAHPGVVVVSAVTGAMSQIEDGLTVTLHGAESVVYEGITGGA